MMRHQAFTASLCLSMLISLVACAMPNLRAEQLPNLDGPEEYCRRDGDNLIIKIENNGNADANTETTTRVVFSWQDGLHEVTFITPAIPSGGSVLHSTPIPPECFDPDCDFEITVDVYDVLKENIEHHNTEVGLCRAEQTQ